MEVEEVEWFSEGPRAWPEPITDAEYQTIADIGLECVSGYLIEGTEESQRRVALLKVLLKNCGLEEAAMLCDKDDWREAAERAFPDFYEGILE